MNTYLEGLLPKIDFAKSISKERLIYRSQYFDLFLLFFVSVILIGCFGTLGVGLYKLSFLLSTILLIVCLAMIINLLLFSKLVRVIKIEKPHFVDFISRRYPTLTLIKSEDNDDLIYFVKDTGWFGWGKIITVLLKENTAYINIITLGRNGAWSPVHGWINYYDCKGIASCFKKS